MTNAHVPNCDVSVTPAWKPYAFPRTKLHDAIKTRRLEGHSDRYAGAVPDYWCSRGGRRLAAHGGFCATVLMTTARQYYQDVVDKSKAVSPIGLHIEFIEPLPKGPFHVALQVRHKGNRQTLIQAEIVPEDPYSKMVYTLALVRLGFMESNDTPDHQAKLPRLPDRNKDCGRWTDATYYAVNPPTSSIRVFCPNDRGSPLWSKVFGGQNHRYQWTKLDEELHFTLEHLPVVADLIPAIPFNYGQDGLEEAYRYMMPTTLMDFTFFSDPLQEEWLLTQTAMSRLHGGRFEMSTDIIDDSGNIIARCSQVCAMIPVRTGKKAGQNGSRL